MNKKQLAERLAHANAELSAIIAKGDECTVEELSQAESLTGEIRNLRVELAKFDGLAHAASVASETAAFISAPVNPLTQTFSAPSTTNLVSAPVSSQPGQLAPVNRSAAIPATVLRSRVSNFRDGGGQTATEKAYQFGHWLFATSRGNERSLAYCREHGIPLIAVDSGGNVRQFAHVENVNASGGFLVPPQWENDLIDLREQFGVVRRIFRNRPMSSDTLSIPRRTSGLTAYWVTDNVAITESTKGWDLVSLSAKKAGVLAKVSSELSEDAIINVADDLAGEIAYAFAALEDDCGLNGDGTSTYGGMTGVRAKLQDVDGAGTDAAGLFVALGGNLYSEILLSDFAACKAKLPKYADNARTRWVCSQQFYSAVMERLMLAAGGITDAMIAAGAQKRFLGYPVEISQKMPTAEANSQVCALLGDFTLGASFGDRRQTTIAMSEHSSFSADVTDIRGTERFDIVVHDVGNSSTAGPIVGLQTAAS